MDFDYQKIKVEESHQREVRLSSLAVLQPKPMPRLSVATATEAPSTKPKPPIKPRRSIKSRAITQAGAGQSHSWSNPIDNDRAIFQERKRIAPSQVLNPPGPLDAQTPSLQAQNLLWFQRTQLPRLSKPMPCWLHGFATRREAEQLLQDKQQGCFLLRLSESKVGFVLSYRGADKCRHFIIEEKCDASGNEGCYIIAGENSKHCSLEKLINYYSQKPVGPFNETLTVPCVQPYGTAENKTKLEIRNTAENDEERVAPAHSRESPSSIATAADVNVALEPAQYAVVKKTLRKSHSLAERHPESDVVQLVQENTNNETENNTAELDCSNTDICVGGDVTQPVDAPYARVNKPQRHAQPSSSDPTDASAWGASAATIESQSFPDAVAVAEQKYCELEPAHMYEEALHTDFPVNHVYSEVNIKGTRDPIAASPPLWTGTTFITTQSSTRPILRLPPRSTLQHAHSPVQAKSSTQNFGVSTLKSPHPYQPEQLLTENSIYEQIPERPNKSRPPFPPLNSKR